MKEKATYENQHTGKMRWGRAVVCAVAGCLAFGLSAGGVAEARIPILGWGAFSQKDATAERYAEARDAGFTHLTQMCETPADAKRLLSLAEKAGIKLAVGMGRSMSGTNAVMRMTADAEALVAAAKDSPALGFYYVVDEPDIAMAESIRDCVARYDALDPAHPCYVNLYGVPRDEKHSRIFTGCATYGEYLDRLYGAVPLKMVSFDVYPVLSVKPLEKGGRLGGAPVTLKERWYETLEIASSFACRRKVPMYAFALATSHGRYPVPTKAHLRLQMYSNLAYGAQLLQYFRYRAVAPWAKRSALFELIREMNQEIQARADVFLGAEVRGVWHTGAQIPIGTRQLNPKALPAFVKSFSTPKHSTVLVSWLKNGGRDYIVVVNRDPNYEMSFTARFAPGSELVRRDGTRVRVDAYEDLFWLDSGDAAVFAAPEEQGTHFVPPKGTSNVAVATVARPGAVKKTVAFLGGSITEMSGFRPRVMKALRAKYPQVDFVEIAAGLASTCSDAGAFRLEEDVLSRGVPDLFIVEEAVNDCQDGHFTQEYSIRGMEGTVRHVLARNPSCAVVVALMVNRSQYRTLMEGGTPEHYAAHAKVAKHYGAAVADVGSALAASAKSGGMSWNEYRNCHPSAAGCDLGAKVVMDAVARVFDPLARPAEARALPPPLDEKSYFNGRFLPHGAVRLGDGWNVSRPNWDSVPGSKRSYFTQGPAIWSERAGSELSFSFKGNAAGLFLTAGPDAGDIEVSVDGGAFRKERLKANYGSLHYPYVHIVADGLADGTHAVRLRVVPAARGKGTVGTAVRIHRICVN